MRGLDVALIDHRIPERRVDFLVSEQDLNLLYRHAFVDCPRGERAPELVRVHSANSEAPPELPEHRLHTSDLESLVRGVAGDKQGV